MKKKLIAVAATSAMITSLAIFGSALAKDRVEVKVTSEPIQSRSTCDKAGGFSLEFDNETSLIDGDRITIDTDYVSPANFTSLCRTIDLLIAPNGAGSSVVGSSGANAWSTLLPVPPSSGIISPVYYEGDVLLAPKYTGGVNFHVYGSAGSQRINFDVVGAFAASDKIDVNAAAGSKLVVKFLDQQTNTEFTKDGIWKNLITPVDNVYETAATSGDNTLCLNVSQWDAATVKGNMDSTADKFTFIPSNPQIAHIVAASSYTAEACKGANCGNIMIGADVAQGSSTCSSFNDANGDDYCPDQDVHIANSLIIQRGGDVAFDAGQYQLTLEVLVNGMPGDNGVYFAGEPAVASNITKDSVCADNAVAMTSPSNFYKADGSLAIGLGTTNCTVVAANRAVKVVTTASISVGPSDDFLKVAMPEMVYDIAVADPNDQVTVRVTLTRAPCGTIITTDHCVGTLVSACPITLTNQGSISFPYFTEGNTDGFWDGIAITNTTGSAGTVTLTMYEADGDVATATVSVPAMGMYVNTLETMIADGLFTLTTSVNGTLGNARSQIVASSTNITIDGFAMMGNNATGVSMGYLPRK